MLLTLHVAIALTSLIVTSFLWFLPSNKGFKLAYGLVGATFVSGTLLVITTHAALLGACEAGLTYLAVVATGLALAHRRFSKQQP